MKIATFFAGLLSCFLGAHAQACDGGLYLNPQVIRGEGTSQTYSALKELTAVKKPAPPCWIYGNPTVGLASGYRPVAINTVPIQAAVLILADVGTVKDGKAAELKDLPAAQQSAVLSKLKTSSCFGVKSGVTTAIVKAENLCGTVVEILPQQGLGQSYLPTKAAFHWQAERWAGLITRLQSAQSSTLKTHFGSDERIHLAQLIVVPAASSSWGSGIYVHADVSGETLKKKSSPSSRLSKRLSRPWCAHWTRAANMNSPRPATQLSRP